MKKIKFLKPNIWPSERDKALMVIKNHSASSFAKQYNLPITQHKDEVGGYEGVIFKINEIPFAAVTYLNTTDFKNTETTLYTDFLQETTEAIAHFFDATGIDNNQLSWLQTEI